MKKNLIVAGAMVFVLIGVTRNANATAPTSDGSLGVTATIDGSINLLFNSDASGVTLTGTGTAAATLPYGTVQMYGGSVPTNVTRTPNSTTSFSVATPFDVHVDKANTTSSNYTLTATLSADETGINAWLINAVNITDGTPATVTAVGTYGSNASHTLTVTIPATNTTGSISRSIAFTATAN